MRGTPRAPALCTDRPPTAGLAAAVGQVRRPAAPRVRLVAEVAALAVPTLLVFADADSIPVSHMAEFYGLLGGGHRAAGADGTARLRPLSRLAILPGLTHQEIPDHPPCYRRLALPFLTHQLR